MNPFFGLQTRPSMLRSDFSDTISQKIPPTLKGGFVGSRRFKLIMKEVVRNLRALRASQQKRELGFADERNRMRLDLAACFFPYCNL